ncbi:MAG: hypothetical protein KDD62_01645, partial [Bdellovibrionales bacterium]|nr:hypothetical protein [Bdellovibrionales bacterium]
AKHELTTRKALRYPPYARLLRIVAQATDSDEARIALENVFKNMKALNTSAQLLGPTQAPLAKLKTRWRWHILCKSNSLRELHQLLATAQSIQCSKNVRVSFDIDPHDLL